MLLPFKVSIGFSGYSTYQREIQAENIRQAIDLAEIEHKEWAGANNMAGGFTILSVVQWSR